MTTRTYNVGPDYAGGLLPSGASAAARLRTAVTRRLRRWRALSLQRQALAELDDRLLKDVGLNREMALAEAERWFWDERSNCP